MTPKAIRPVLSGAGKRKRYTRASAKYECQFCGDLVDHCEVDHEVLYCTAFKSAPMVGGLAAYTPVKRARLAELTLLELKRQDHARYPLYAVFRWTDPDMVMMIKDTD